MYDIPLNGKPPQLAGMTFNAIDADCEKQEADSLDGESLLSFLLEAHRHKGLSRKSLTLLPLGSLGKMPRQTLPPFGL